MCMVSVVMDSYQPWQERVQRPWTTTEITDWVDGVSRKDFNKLKEEVKELRKLMKAAMDFDKKTGQSGCENDEKIKLLKSMAEALGVDLTELVYNK